MWRKSTESVTRDPAEQESPQRGFKPGERRLLLLLGLAVAVATYLGFRLFFFLTDDAYIAFRYISNRRLGFGYVWNPPPFLPVEGYTSWLWVALLDLVWTATGVPPPDAANSVSLLLGFATLYLGYRFVARMALPPELARHRLLFLALILLGTVTNRTFLAWLSSGLETSLFNFCFTLWIYHALAPSSQKGRAWVFWLSLATTLTALARPDGLLALLGTAALLGLHVLARPAPLRRCIGELACAFPIAGVPLHLIWRRWTYGEWLPNTYYAKYNKPWPESGWRYAASFALEYALWIWVALALTAAVIWVVRRRRLDWAAVIVGLVIAAHAAYYTLIIGGDHFEYRVYSHLVLLLFISFLWLGARLGLRARTTLALIALFVVASWPVPWMHYFETRGLLTRQETFPLSRPIAQEIPPVVRLYVGAFDDVQEWLIQHSVCRRHQEHKVFWQQRIDSLPSREQGERIGWEDRPVLVGWSVGVVGWILPHVAVIDGFGLNDYVIARTRVPPERTRLMAHERRPPLGYVDCFRPNFYMMSAPTAPPRIMRQDEERTSPLTDDEIRQCEARFRAAL